MSEGTDAGLMRELDERRVVVLPLLLEDCQIPTFLREKMYADFRTNFDDGLNEILKGIAAVTSDTQGRVEKPDFHIDWGIGWGESNGQYALHVRFIDHSEKISFCVLTELRIICNDKLTQKLNEYSKQGLDWFGRVLIVELLYEAAKREALQSLVLEDSLDKQKTLHFLPDRNGYALDAYISSVRLGSDTGMNTLVDWGEHIKYLIEELKKEVSETDRERLREVLRSS